MIMLNVKITLPPYFRRIQFVVFVMFAFFHRPDVLAKEAPKSGIEPLYKVALDEEIQRSKVTKRVSKKKLVHFLSKPFTDRIKKYEVFLVLDEKESGVIAEIAIKKKPKKKQKKILARVIRMADVVTVNDLVERTVVRLTDLEQIIENSTIFRSNPSINLGMADYSRIDTAVNALTSAIVNPVVTGTGFYLEAFAPEVTGGRWVNWLGLRYSQLTQNESTIDIKSVRQESTQTGVITSSSSHAEIVFRPWFRDFFIHRVALFYGVLNKSQTDLALQPSALIKESTLLSLSRSWTSMGGEISINPTPVLYIGMIFSMSSGSLFEVLDSSTPDQIYSGNWDQNHLITYISVNIPLYLSLKASLSLILDRREDTIYNLNDFGNQPEFSVTDFSSMIKFGVIYSF